MRRRLGPRFGVEAGLIAAAAVVAALLELDWPGIVAIVFGTWLAIAIFEVAWARTRAAAPPATAPAAPAVGPASTAVPEPPAAPAPLAPPPSPARVAAPPSPPPTPTEAQAPPPPPVEPPERQPAVGAPRTWNLWELERAARDLAGDDAAADEERQYMLLYLRDFATPDGKLPIDFDPLVREVFGERPVVAS